MFLYYVRTRFAVAAIAITIIAGRPAAADQALELAAADAKQAADTFAAMAAEARNTGAPPRDTDPAINALLTRVFNTDVLKDRSPVPYGAMNTLNVWLTAVQTAGQVYIFAGTGIPDSGAANMSDPELVQKLSDNQAKFASEMGRYLDAALYVMGTTVSTVITQLTADPSFASQPNVQIGMGMIRQGALGIAYSGVVSFTNPGTADTWRLDRIPALIFMAESSKGFFLADQCSSLKAAAGEVAKTMATAKVKEGLTNFAGKLGC